MACPEDAFTFSYRDAPFEHYPARFNFFHHIESCGQHTGPTGSGPRLQSTYRENIGSYFNIEKAKRRDRRNMLRRKRELGLKEYDSSRDVKWAVKGNKLLQNSRSEPELNSEYRDRMRGLQGGFRDKA